VRIRAAGIVCVAAVALGLEAGRPASPGALPQAPVGVVAQHPDLGSAERIPAPLPGRTADPLLVADLGSLSADERLMLVVLQGLVNRSRPQIYYEGIDDTSRTWLSDAVPLAPATIAPYSLLTRFRTAISGLAIWDPAMAVDTQNIATTMAGLESVLPVSPSLAGVLTGPPYNLPVVEDLRRQHFTSRAQAYDWAVAHLGPPSRFSALAWIGGPRHGIRDLLVARRAFVFQAEAERDHDMVMRILDAFPRGTPVFGYPCLQDQNQLYRTDRIPLCEPIGVGEISSSGKFLIPSDLAANLTVHSWFQPQEEHLSWDDHTRHADPSKTYVCFIISDGDNVGYNEEWLRLHQWTDPNRGRIPIGISISPWLRVYAPRIYDYYVRGLTANEVLVSGPSGAGYVYPGFDPDLDGYLAQSRRLMGLAGLRAVWILDNGYGYSPTPGTTQRYVAALHPPAIFADYFGWVVANPPAVSFSSGVPVIHAVWGDSVPTAIERIKATAASYSGRPAFVFVALNTWSMDFSRALEVMKQLGPGYVAVRPDELVGLIRGSAQIPAAGPGLDHPPLLWLQQPGLPRRPIP